MGGGEAALLLQLAFSPAPDGVGLCETGGTCLHGGRCVLPLNVSDAHCAALPNC